MPHPRIEDYLVNITPWDKQREAFAFITDETKKYKGELTALICEQRTGKTPVALAKLAHHYLCGDIDAALVVAMPSGVPRGWADEIDGNPAEGRLPKLTPLVPRSVLVWRASKARTKRHLEAQEALLKFDGLAILVVNGEAVLTEPFRLYAGRFLRARKTFAIIDETSLVIRAPGNKRTKVLNGVRKLTRFRMILDGTPADESPLDLYSQYGWLSTDVLGQPTSLAFKHHYAEWETRSTYDRGVRREYPAVKEDPETGLKLYRNVDELRERMASVSFFCRRAECFDIPDKVYRTYRFDLSPTQRRVYDELREKYEAELVGATVGARHVLTRILRLQQVASSNVWPSERALAPCASCRAEGCPECDGLGAIPYDTDPIIIDPKGNPRLAALEEVLSTETGPAIVWARFRRDVDDVVRLGERLGRRPVRYDGSVPSEQKHENRVAFQTGRAGLFVANQGAAQRGLDLSAAEAHVYYSNTFSGLQRRQTEDRTEVSGRRRGTGVVDLVADDTVDEDIVAAHLAKGSVADVIMGRPPGRRFA